MMIRFLVYIAFVGVFQVASLFFNIAFATIRDTEIENTIRVLSHPILQAANYDIDQVEFRLINQNIINAFVANGQKIHLYTGLIMATKTPEQLQGVIAHELSHIVNGHLVRLSEQIKHSNKNNLLISAASIPLAILTGETKVALAGLGFGHTVAQRGFFKFSRGMEEEADQGAVNLLNKSNISLQGMLEFFDILVQNEKLYGHGSIIYTRTHPLNESRRVFLKQALSQTQEPPKQKQAIYIQFNRMRAKLIGYINPLEDVLKIFPLDNQSFYASYARAFAYANRGKNQQALQEIEKLVALHPNDVFLRDSYGDVLRLSGMLDKAMEQYQIVLKKLPWASLIHLNVAHIMLEQYQGTNDDVIFNHLQQARLYEDDNPELWRLYAKIYDFNNKKLHAMISHSRFAYLMGNLKQAKSLAHKVRDTIDDEKKSNPILRQQAQDILQQIKVIEDSLKK